MAGYYRGLLDTIVMRLTDALLAFPFLIIAVGPGGHPGPVAPERHPGHRRSSRSPSSIRVTRGEVLGLREETFVQAAIADGAPDRSVIFRQILPNTLNALLVQATIILPFAILAEATLSFLGLGVQPPTPSWGVMLTAAQPYLGIGAVVRHRPGTGHLRDDPVVQPRRRRPARRARPEARRMTTILDVRDVSVQIRVPGGRRVQAVDRVSFTVAER